jgi:flagellar export protein FliJ
VRRTKLEVIRRLAELDADRALHGLGIAHSSMSGIEVSLESVRKSSADSRRQRALDPGQRADAATISAAHRCESVLSEQDDALVKELVEARVAHERAREVVAKAKLRVRAIENAIGKRARRARLEASRAETRRTDELARSATRIEEQY